MAITESPRASLSPSLRRSIAAFLCTALIAPAFALDFNPGVQVIGIYSDNIRLQRENPVDDIVLSVAPTIGIQHYGQKVILEADYLYQWIFYEDAAEGKANFGNGSAALGLELVDERFFIDSFVSQSQTYVDPLGPIPNTNTQLVTNRADLLNLQTTPRLVLPIFSATLDTAGTLGRIDFDDPTLQDADYLRTNSTLGTAATEPGITWSVKHLFTRFEYELPPVANRQELRLELGYNIGSWGVFGQVGKESPFVDPTDSSLTDRIWQLGLRYQLARTSFRAFIGERSFGDTYGLRLTQDLSRGFIAIDYQEQPTRTEQIFAARPNPDLDPLDPAIPPLPDQGVDINQPGIGSVFVQKRLSATWTQTFNKNDFSFLLFNERREDEILQDGSLQPNDVNSTGARLNWKYRLGRRTELLAELAYSQRRVKQQSATLKDDFITAIGSIQRALSRKINATLYYAFRERDGNISSGAYFRANEVGLTLTANFGSATQRPPEARDIGYR